MSASSRKATAPVREGDVLAGKYRVEQVLGSGGMGVVVAATHIELGERVALKFLLPESAADGETVARFMREARATARLKGAHVARVLDVGRLDDGIPYLVMEHLQGCDLGAELEARGPLLPVEEVIDWLLQACEGLAEAHAGGLVHRDLKPANLFLTHAVDGTPLVKLLDFGISKTVGSDGTDLSLTRTSTALGSPLYMSPEQMRSAKSVDHRADIWSLGIIAYELLSGRPPFEARSVTELCMQVAEDRVRPLRTVRPGIPDALDDAVLRCLEKDPRARFDDVAELARAIEPFAPERARGGASRAAAVLGADGRRGSTPTVIGGPRAADSEDAQIDSWGTTQRQVVTLDATPAKASSRASRVAFVGIAAGVLVGALLLGRAAVRTTTAADGSSLAGAAPAPLALAGAAPAPLAPAPPPPPATAEPAPPSPSLPTVAPAAARGLPGGAAGDAGAELVAGDAGARRAVGASAGVPRGAGPAGAKSPASGPAAIARSNVDPNGFIRERD